MVEFRLFGIPVTVMPIFWLTLGLIGLMIGADLRDSQGWLVIALFVLAGFISILIHELGHALMIRRYQLPTKIVLAAFGGYAVYPAGMLNRLQSFLVTAAGPGLQLLAAGLTWYGLSFIELPDTMIQLFVGIFIQVSMFWAILNCLPILPLDGGQMLAAILGPKRQSTVLLISTITATLMALAALYLGEIYIVLFMGMFAWQNFQAWQQSKNQF